MERKGKKEIRHGRVLFRSMGPDMTYKFTVCIEIDYSVGEYISTVLPFGPGFGVISSGGTPDEAEMNAILSFCRTVDDCLDTDELENLLGHDIPLLERINAPIEALKPFFRENASVSAGIAAVNHMTSTPIQAGPDIPKPWELPPLADLSHSCELG